MTDLIATLFYSSLLSFCSNLEPNLDNKIICVAKIDKCVDSNIDHNMIPWDNNIYFRQLNLCKNKYINYEINYILTDEDISKSKKIIKQGPVW